MRNKTSEEKDKGRDYYNNLDDVEATTLTTC